MTTSESRVRQASEPRTPFARRRDPLRAPFPRRADGAERLRRLTDRARAELAGDRLSRLRGRGGSALE